MRITVLGSAAGGGFPQWNCHCRNCCGVADGTLRAKPRTQSSIFIQPQGLVDGILFNASPDILQQIKATPALKPGRRPRDSAIAAIVLIDGQIDHTTGLLMLRERGTPLPVWCTDAVHEDLTTGHPVLSTLQHFCGVERHGIPLAGESFGVAGLTSLRLRALPLRSKAAPYSPHRDAPVAGDNIGVTVTDTVTGGSVFYAPGLGAVDAATFDTMASADAVLVDGTFWRDDEMPALGLSSKSARDIGHLPQWDPAGHGMLDVLARLPARVRRVLIHINNTNPILDEDSPERAMLDRAGVQVAEDGLVIDL